MTTRRLASLTILSLALGSWSCAPATMAAQSASGCRPNDNNKVPARLAYFKGLLADTDTTSVNFRSAFQLQQVAVNKVSLVTKASTCASAATAVNTVRGTPGVIRQVWVYALGTNYAVEDPTISEPAAGAIPIYLFNGTWVAKPILMY
jgi:hypothetical protein